MTAQQKLKIVYRSLKELIPYARNARTHSDSQVAQIAASIKEFGWTQPILLDGKNGIIAGHGRFEAAFKLAMHEVPTIDLAHLTETQKRAYVIADNKISLNSGWDEQMLALEIGDLKDAGFDIDLLAFDPSELKNADIDYSVLDDDEIDAQLDDMAKGVRKAIQIEFEPEHYEEAQELVKFWRDEKAYVGMMLMQHLKNEKNKL
jgi:ParB-like chromosome segregation protein Spo0J